MMKFRHLFQVMIVPLLMVFLLLGFTVRPNDTDTETSPADYDPVSTALESTGQIRNYEATVPPQCYTKTAGVANPCYTCHTSGTLPNEWQDWDLQEEYAFSDMAMTNHWSNLFKDRSKELATISTEEVLAWVRGDNYTPFVEALKKQDQYQGYVPDLDFNQGFASDGFAVDNSGWRAIRYKPFPGTFWPTNGSTDDVFVRLPIKFRTKGGVFHKETYKANLAILDAVMAAGPMAGEGDKFRHQIEPINEQLVDLDLNGNGKLDDKVEEIVGFPKMYLGDAADVKTRRYLHPKDTEYLHTVRYLDPDAKTLTARRMKEVRYSKKVMAMDSWALNWAYEREYNKKEVGDLPIYKGSPMHGLISDLGWQLQGFIEDEQGRLRLQTHEEHQFCMGCHGAIGVNVDTTFTLPRKTPGASGWAYQNTTGIKDVPQQGQTQGEIAQYFERVGGGDEFRANAEVIKRFFKDGKPIAEEIKRAAPGGDKDMNYLVSPSRERALDLNRAYMLLVREQKFDRGRDAVIGPIQNVHKNIDNGETDLAKEGKVFKDSKLWLDWSSQKKH